MLLRTSWEAHESNTYLKWIYHASHVTQLWYTVSGKDQLTKLMIGFRAAAAAAALSQAPDKMITYFQDRLCRNCETICKSVSTFTLLCVRSSVAIYACYLFRIKQLMIYIYDSQCSCALQLCLMCQTSSGNVILCIMINHYCVWNTSYIYKPHNWDWNVSVTKMGALAVAGCAWSSHGNS